MDLSPANRQDPHLRVHAVNIFVRDQERSLRFYLDRLGFELAFDARLPNGQRWVAVAPRDGTAVLALIAPRPGSDEYKRIGTPTGVVLVTEDVTAKFREWSDRGVHFRHTPRLKRVKYSEGSGKVPNSTPVWGGVFTRFEDLDHNVFELVSFDEVSQAVEAQRRVLAEKLELERRAEQELEIAKRVQARLFPQTSPVLKTLDYAGTCIQARQVGGDYYDFLDLGRQRLGLVIGDIAGKGIAAALLMANLQANLRSRCAVALTHPRKFLQSVNHLFYSNTVESAYATLVFAEYNDRSRCLRYANCGHLCALLLRRDNTVERLESTGTVLGLFEAWDCEIGECTFKAGDLFVLYTDGITESENDKGEDFGEHGLIDALRKYRVMAPAEMMASIVRDVQLFSPHEQHDDITLIIARCR
jgi:serine phosphatase RsbU (regulator of sigma subunit)/catechol 2,3-dioxygenase-like lactoylglutathione lyase family enzyme